MEISAVDCRTYLEALDGSSKLLLGLKDLVECRHGGLDRLRRRERLCYVTRVWMFLLFTRKLMIRV